MKLKVVGSGSHGNCYLLETQTEVLMIEAGMKFQEVKKALNFDISKIVGCLVSHEHQDHGKSVKDLLNAGISVYASEGTLGALHIADTFNSYTICPGKIVKVGEFDVLSFPTKHDAAEPVGFLIRHSECGTVLFATDTYYLQQRFKGLNNILIECNYEPVSLREKFETGIVIKPLYERLLTSHMSLHTCLKMLALNDLKAVCNIVLIHLSDSNSDAGLFQSKVETATGKKVIVADSGLEIEFNKTAF